MNRDAHTLHEARVEVTAGHQLYTQLWGSQTPQETFINLHGGPGSGTKDSRKDVFDPDIHQVLFFDQRGSGKSQPSGSLENNTTQLLVDDIDHVADHYDLDRFSILGNSWGACLALIYAIKNQQRVDRMVLQGIFTAREQEVQYVHTGGFKTFHPDAWDEFLETVPDDKRDDPVAHHYEHILGDNPSKIKSSGYAYDTLLGEVVSINPLLDAGDYDQFNPTAIRIQCYYDQNKEFIPEGYVLDNASAIKIPVDIVQGRYDMICRPHTAYELHTSLTNSRIYWTQAGHSPRDAENVTAVRALLLNLDD